MKYLKTFTNRLYEAETQTQNEIEPQYFDQVNKFLETDYENFIKDLTGESGVPSEEKVAQIDPKVQAILNMGKKDKEIRDEVVNYQKSNLSVKNLRPTQSQIGFLDSIGYVAFLKPEQCKSSLSGVADFGGATILTSDGKYILDGHHRWSGVFMLNPDAEIPCVNLSLNLDGKNALKVVQLAIAAEYGALLLKPANAKTDIFNDDITGPDGEKLKDMLKNIFEGKYGIPKGGSLDNVKRFKEILQEAWNTDEEGVLDKLVEHAKMIKGYKPENAPARGFMPQPSDTAKELGKPKDDGPGGMPKDVFNKLASGDLNFKKSIEPKDKVVDNYNNFIKKNR